MKQKYGILAFPAKHSLSPAMHNAAFKYQGIDAEYGFFEISSGMLGHFMTDVVPDGVSGLSVSLPYKQAVMEFLDEVNEEALRIGAVNTVVNRGGKLAGHNTDVDGAIQALKEAYGDDLRERIAVVLGAGGAARAITYGLLREGVHVWVKNRTKEKADRIAIEFAELFQDAEVHSDKWGNLGTGDILINTTSIWFDEEAMNSGEMPYFCDKEYLEDFEVVMDISYNLRMPNSSEYLMTPLLQSALELDKTIVTGEKMLLYQAVRQFELWTEQKAPLAAMKQALLENL